MKYALVVWCMLVAVFAVEPPVVAPGCLSEWPSLIIRTTESIRNGAEFLDSKENSTPQECDEMCCQNGECNVSVLSRFGQCFLFNCISNIDEKFVCTFSQNPNFNVFVKVTQVLRYYAEHNDLNEIKNSSTVDHSAGVVQASTDESCARLDWLCDNKG